VFAELVHQFICLCKLCVVKAVMFRDVRNRFFFYFGLVFEKNSDSIQNEFGSVLLKKRGSDRIL